jgi:hypothetical protein
VKRQEHIFRVCLWMIPWAALPAVIEANEADRIRPYTQNPRYRQYRGRLCSIITRYRP